MAAPRSGSYNTPTVSWSTSESLMINPVVADLLRIPALYSRNFFLNPSVFYHPVQEKCMVDDASRLFSLSDTKFLTYMSVVHPQLHGSWKISLPLPELLSCVISTLCRKPCQPALLKMRDSRGCTISGTNSVPPCQSVLLSKIHPYLASRSSKSKTTAFITTSTPSAGCINLGNNQFLRLLNPSVFYHPGQEN